MKPYLILFSILIANPVWAEWSLITSSADSDPATHFIDFETLRKEGNLRKVWQLVNLPPNDKDGWSSVRLRIEFDCKKETMKTTTFAVFPEHFANGKATFTSENPTAIRDVAPETVSWTILKEVCKR
jgi:hypothetical protein